MHINTLYVRLLLQEREREREREVKKHEIKEKKEKDGATSSPRHI